MISEDSSKKSQTPSKNGTAEESETRKVLRPVTVQQLLNAQQAYSAAPFTVDGDEIDQVNLVAYIPLSGVREYEKRYKFLLCDGSRGSIEAEQWRYPLSDAPSFDAWRDTGVRPQVYVRVSGRLRRYSERNYLEVFNISKIQKFIEIFYHQLEAMSATLHCKRGPPARDVFISITESSAMSATPNRVASTSSAAATVAQKPQDTEFDFSFDESVRTPTKTQRPGRNESPPRSPSAKIVRNESPLVESSGATQSTAAGRDIGKQKTIFPSSIRATYLTCPPQSRSRRSSGGNSDSDTQIKMPGAFDLDERQADISSPPISPEESPVSPKEHRSTRSRPLKDPYSDLTFLQRHIILLIQEAKPKSAPSTLYPRSPRGPTSVPWEGLHVTRLAEAIDPQVGTLEEVNVAIDYLVDEGYVYCPLDLFHLDVLEDF